MPLYVSPGQIALRLLLTVISGMLIGLNRDESGKPTGMRTTTLVALAAAVSMIEANLLLPTAGKTGSSFAVLDLMRFPLGILSGMGFLGAGVIIRRNGNVSGVTTAATLWFITVAGLCFGGGQLKLGAVTVLIALCILWAIKPIERHIRQLRSGRLVLTFSELAPEAGQIRTRLDELGLKAGPLSLDFEANGRLRQAACEVKWKTSHGDPRSPAAITALSREPWISTLEWRA
jgi:putative Mg2+ transporter-C (MgtC) family protein